MNVQLKIGTCVVHIVSFCFQIALVIDLKIRFCNGFTPIKLAKVMIVLLDVSLEFRKKKRLLKKTYGKTSSKT